MLLTLTRTLLAEQSFLSMEIGLYRGNTENEYASERDNMTLLNNFFQEPWFECIFHPAWGKQFVPLSCGGSYQGVMQFIFVLKFSKLSKTEDTLACFVPLVILTLMQHCFLFSLMLLCWMNRSSHKILWWKNSS